MENQKVHLEKLLNLFTQVALLSMNETIFLSLMFDFPIGIQTEVDLKHNHIFIQIYIKRYKIILFFALLNFV